jgi:hypothetical protein
VAVVAIAGDDLIALLQRHLHADHDSFLADIEVTKAADRAHAVKLAGFFLEPADQQHLAKCVKLLILARAENQPNFGFEMLVLADHPNEIARMHIVELVTRSFVEHVGVDPVGTKQ